MNSSDLIAHLEGIGKDARVAEDIFKTLSAAEKFTLRLDAFRRLAKDAGKTEFSLAEIAENLFPGLKPESFRTASAEFRATVSKITETTNRDFRIVQPDLRKRSLDERKWICEGGFADEALVALSRKGIEKLELAGVLTELLVREDEDPEIAALREKEEPAELHQVEAMARFTHHEIRDLIGEEDDYEELHANPEQLATLGESKGVESKTPEVEGIPLLPELTEWANDPDSCAYLALLGETGCGKTMTAMELAGKLLDEPAAPIAIYFDLRLVNQDGLLKRNRRPLLADILKAMLNRSGMDNPPSAEAVIDAVSKREALLIWDGLDEVLVGLTADEGEAFFAQLQAILPVAECHREGSGRLMFGCRTQFFRNVAQEKSVFTGSQRDRLDPVSAENDDDEMKRRRRADFKILRVLPFTEAQIRSYLESNVAGLDVERALEVINTVHNLRELAGRPYLLSLMRSVLPNLDTALADGRPVRSIDLYAGFIDQWIARDTGKHQLLPHDKLRIMALLAGRMWKDNLRVLPVTELEQWLFETLLNEPVWKSTYGSKIESDERDLLLEDFRTATFLGRWDGDEFRFAHTSLQEYFLARALFDSLDAGDPGPWSLPMPSPETFGFLAEMWTQASEANPESVASRLEASLSKLLRSSEANAAKQPAFAFYLTLHRGPHGPSAPAIDSIDLSGGLDFTASEIRGESGRRLPLRRAIFSGSKWLRAVFESVDLSESVFADCDLRSAEFLDSDLSGADFENIGPSRMEGVLTRHCRLSGATAPPSAIPGLRLLGNRWENDSPGEREWRNCTDLRHAVPLADEILANAEVETSNLKLERATGHSHWVRACAPIGDGARFLSASSDHSLILWDTESGELIRRFEGHSDRVSACAPIGDGARFLSASSDHSLILWDTESGELIRRFESHSAWVNACAPIGDGARFLSASSDNSVILWDTESGELLRRFDGHSNWVSGCAPIGDGARFLSTSGDNSLILWDIESGELIRRFEGHSASVRACAPIGDGARFLSASGKSLILWDTESGELIRRFESHSHWVNACAPIGDGARFLSASSDNSVILWDTESGELLRRFEGHSNWVSGCAPIGDGARFLSASGDHSVILWDTESGELIRRFQGHFDWVSGCAPIGDGARFLSASGNNSLILWDTESGELIRRFEGHSASVRACAPIGDGARFLSASHDNSLILWDTESGELIRRFQGHSDWVSGCAPIGDGTRFLSASHDNSLFLWDTKSGELLRRFQGHSASVSACVPIGDGARFLSASHDNSVILWDTESGELIRRFEGHSDRVKACAPIGDGARFLSASSDNGIILWDTESGELLRRFEGHSNWVNGCAPIGDGARFLSASHDNSVILWDTESGELIWRFQGHSASVRACAPIGGGARFLSASSDHSLILWDTESGEILHRYFLLPHHEAASRRGKENRLAFATPGAWRYFNYLDPEKGIAYPAEIFGPLPSGSGTVN